MSLLTSMLGAMRSSLSGRAATTPEEVRSLLDRREFQAARAAIANLAKALANRRQLMACLEGEVLFREGDSEAAEAAFRQLLDDAPAYPEAHYGLSLVLTERGEVEAGLEHALFARTGRQSEGRMAAQVGYCFTVLRAYPSAEEPLLTAVMKNRHDKQSWNNLGIVLASKGELVRAVRCFRNAVELDPGFASAISNLAVAESDLRTLVEVGPAGSGPNDLSRAAGPDEFAMDTRWLRVQELVDIGAIDEAIASVESLLDAAPDSPADLERATAFFRSVGEPETAVDVTRGFVHAHPEWAVGHRLLGESLLYVEDQKGALEALERAVDLDPGDATAQSLVGYTLHVTGRYAAAVEAHRRAAAIDPSAPILKRLASGLVMACRYDEALDVYDDLVRTGKIQRGDMLGNYAMALSYLGRFDEAMSHLDAVLGQHAHDLALRLLRGTIHLQHERYADGWNDYQWRGLSVLKQFRVPPLKKWSGEALEGKTLLLLAEQGLGDQVMFASCIPDLLARCPRRVYLEAIDRVAPTLERSFPDAVIIPSKQDRSFKWLADLEPIDFYLPLGDLPRFFRPDRASFPRTAFLVPNPARVAHWRGVLDSLGSGPKIGISWKGGIELTRTSLRSIDPVDFAFIAQAAPGSHVINLQYGDVTEALQSAARDGLTVHHWPEAIQDLDEFSALCRALDLVVTVCNTTVHYAGSVGQDVIVLAPKVPEWRYGVYYRQMAWYPSVEVIRQREHGDWGSVLETVGRMVGDKFRQ